MNDSIYTLRFLRVDFKLPVTFNEIYKFRAAIADRVGSNHILFHHHYQDEQNNEKVLYRYPLIQYKRLYGNASIVCLGDGNEEIHHLFNADQNWEIRLGSKKVTLKIDKLRLHEYQLEVKPKDELYTYTLQKWLALNTENFLLYRDIQGLRARLEFLENILRGNISTFIKGLGWYLPRADSDRLQVIIDECEQHTMPYKGQSFIGFSVKFHTNLFIPSYIGLGKGVSRGYGMIKFMPDRNRVESKRKRQA